MPCASYQRLEFLGDRVLGLVISEMLIEEFPDARRRANWRQRLTALVRNEACAEVARTLDLGEAIRLGGGEAQSGGRRKAAILGDACEALIGAVYLEGGLEPARRFVVAELARARCSPPRASSATPRPRCRNGRRAGGSRPRPTRSSAAAGPDHAPRFEVEVKVERPARRAAAPAARGARPSRTPRPPR